MTMNKALLLATGLLLTGIAQADAIFGSGATFPSKVYHAWGREYKAQTGLIMAYLPLGSGKGIADMTAEEKTKDFGGTDKPLSLADLDKFHLMQFPALIGGVIPVVNLKHVGDGDLKLDGTVLSNIYLGKITRWDDPAIKALNSGMTLPNDAINVLYRSDKSGSTFNMTNYFSKVNPEWKSTMGEGTSVAWKVGKGEKGAEGIAKQIENTPNSIGYVDPALVIEHHLTYVKLRNRAGTFVAPDQKSFAAAAVNATWNAGNGFSAVLTDQPGQNSWPLATATYVLLTRNPTEITSMVNTLKFFDWGLKNGGKVAQSLHFVPIPDEVQTNIRQAWNTQIHDPSGQPVWK